MIEERALADGKTLPKTADGVDATVLIGQPIFVRTASVPEEHRAIALILDETGEWFFAIDDATGWDFHDGAVLVRDSYFSRDLARAETESAKEAAAWHKRAACEWMTRLLAAAKEPTDG